jgi:lysozyme family protein
MTVFAQCFTITVGIEGVFSDDASDPGNWTGGAVNVGVLKGTKYGVSAKAYPTLDIENLTLADVMTIYQRDYWAKLSCDQMPPQMACLMFDAGVNNGVPEASRLLQQALGVAVDGDIGPQTLSALAVQTTYPKTSTPLASEFMARRIVLMAGLPEWSEDGLGWARRLAVLPYKALTVTP